MKFFPKMQANYKAGLVILYNLHCQNISFMVETYACMYVHINILLTRHCSQNFGVFIPIFNVIHIYFHCSYQFDGM